MSTTTSFSSASSTPVVPTQEIITQDILNNIAGVATNYANQLFSWGQGVFNGLSGDISGIMGKLSTAADTAMTGTNQAMDQFTKGFIPDYNNLRTEAGQYANVGRQARNAGMAESDQMQGNRAAMNDALQKLEGMGVDTSSGRYAHDLLTGETQGAAAAAGAGTQSIRADEQTALGLKKNALDYGIQMPGIAANFLNAANNARSISGNLDIGKTNAGTALMQVPNAYLNTALMDRYPPIGQASSHQTSSQSERPDTSNRGSNSSRSGGGGFNDTPTGTTFNGLTHGGANPSGGDNGSGVFNPNGGGYTPPGYIFPPDGGDPGALVQPLGGDFGSQSQIDPWANEFQLPGDTGGGFTDTGQFVEGSGGTDTGNGFNDTGGYNTNDFSLGSDNSSVDSFMNNVDSSGNVSPGYDTGSGGYTDTSGYDSFTPSDSSGFNDVSNEDTYTGDYATGGAIPTGPTQGGFVPQEASPSNGQQTDDIHASLNANEFVIPRDVSLWKGQEFFQKLIAQSRKNLAQAGARGQPAPAPQGPVRFASRPMGQ